jgi:hypothetical protein
VTRSESASIGGQTITQASNPWGFMAVQANWGISSSWSDSVTYSITQPFTIPNGQYIKVFFADSWTEYRGTASEWGLNGYAGETTATGEKHPGTFSLWSFPYPLPGP